MTRKNRRKSRKPRPAALPLWKRSRFLWTLLGAVSVILITVVLAVTLNSRPAVPIQAEGPRCAIIDQLSMFPNPEFMEANTDVFQEFGYEVDVFQGDEITVDFLESLPERGYKVILFRVHAAVKNTKPEGTQIWMFTSQPYSRMTCYLAQIKDQVTPARTRDETSLVFAISPRFVTDCMRGSFNNAVIINMGCEAFYSTEMAEAFIRKGASAYTGWDAVVGLQYVDRATLTLVDRLYARELPLAAAVEETLREAGPDPGSGAELKFYPASSAGLTVRQLAR